VALKPCPPPPPNYLFKTWRETAYNRTTSMFSHFSQMECPSYFGNPPLPIIWRHWTYPPELELLSFEGWCKKPTVYFCQVNWGSKWPGQNSHVMGSKDSHWCVWNFQLKLCILFAMLVLGVFCQTQAWVNKRLLYKLNRE
jgi:hypothetical protein